jgi:ammonium transporter, Amt family
VNIGGLAQFEAQVVAVLFTLIWSGVLTFIILKVVDVAIGLRVTAEEEREGLDVVLHGERIG